MIPTTTTRLLAVTLLALFATLPACDNSAEAPPAIDLTDPANYTEGQSYTVRGEITQLPDAGPPPAELKIRHEHIPDFIGKTGEVFVNSDGTPGMRAMNMGFPYLAPTVALDEYTVGDKVEFTFLVRWDTDPYGERTPTWLIGAMTKLPADTEISYDNKPVP
jgi:hypothetical protein